MKLLALLALSALVTSCDDSIRNRSTISQSSSRSSLTASLAPKVGTVANIYVTSDNQSFDTQGESIETVKSSTSTYIKSVILKVEGNLVYKFIESRTGANPIERQVHLEFIDLNKELSNLVKKNNADISGDNIRINMPLDSEGMSEPQIFNNQMISYENSSEYEAIFSLKKPFCEFRSVLTTTSSLYVDGAFRDSAVSELWERSSCGRELSIEELRSLDLKAINFCDGTLKIKKCEIKNLENIKP